MQPVTPCLSTVCRAAAAGKKGGAYHPKTRRVDARANAQGLHATSASDQLPSLLCWDWQVGETVTAEVQLMREGEEYAIVSLPEHGQALGCVGVQDCNVRDLSVSRQLSLGSRQKLLVAAHPSPDTGQLGPPRRFHYPHPRCATQTLLQ